MIQLVLIGFGLFVFYWLCAIALLLDSLDGDRRQRRRYVKWDRRKVRRRRGMA